MYPGKRFGAVVAFFSIVVLVVAGCGFVGSDTVISTPLEPITLKNTAPDQLDAQVMVQMGDTDAPTRDSTLINVTFAASGRPVRMIANEQVVCNGTVLNRYDGGFAARMATTMLVGKPITCVYTSGASSATTAFTLPAAPVIIAPQEGSAVARSAQTIVRYQVSDVPQAVLALDTSGKVFAPKGAISVNQATLDTSTLTAGAGQIALAGAIMTLATHNPGFKSLVVQVTPMTMVVVTWV